MNAYILHNPIIGKRLFALAIEWSRNGAPTTQSKRETAINAIARRKAIINGSRSIRAARDAVEAAQQDIARARRLHLKAEPAPAPAPLESRLAARVSGMVAALIETHYRTDPAGTVRVAPGPERIEQSQADDWDYYAKSCRYPKRITTTTIRAPHGYLSQVRRNNLAVVDGLVTVAATPTPDPGIYNAAWIEQGPGYTLRLAYGYIARAGEFFHHAKTPESARRGVANKQAAARRAAKLANLELAVDEHPNAPVTVSDAHAIGACDAGIDSWLALNGWTGETTKPAKDVFAAYQLHPLPEARAAIAHALRRAV